jgi:hypothetical protein
MKDDGKLMFTDKEILDWLQAQNNKSSYTGQCVFRWSSNGRGWRLHETNIDEGVTDVRQAIVIAMLAERA